MTEGPTPENPYYSVPTVAQMFDVTTHTVRQWIREGKLDADKIAGRLRIPKSSVTAFANKEFG